MIEKIAEILQSYGKEVYVAQNDLSKEWPPNARKVAAQILQAFVDDGWVQKAENQSLPPCEPRSDHDHKGGVCNCRECRIIKAVQQNMITDGWVKAVK